MMWQVPPLSKDGTLRLHGTSVAFEERAVLLVGPSGSGKSSLALQLMASGAALICDDQVCVSKSGAGVLRVSAPKTAMDLIEARGFGLLNADLREASCLSLIIDMGTVETERLPKYRCVEILGETIRFIHKCDTPAFFAAVRQYLLCGEVQVT